MSLKSPQQRKSIKNNWFLSYNQSDKDVARAIGVLLQSQNVPIWLDEWRIGPGDSIVHEVSLGLEQASGLLVLWSKNAARSKWVERELSAAISKMLRKRGAKSKRFRVVPIRIDKTSLPQILEDTSYVDWQAGSQQALEQILGAVGKKDVGRRSILMGINGLLATLDVRMFSAVPVVACERCGSEDMREFRAEDPARGDTYFCIECNECGWQDGGEV